MDAPDERRPHLACRANHEDVAVQPADAFEIRVGWFREELLELRFVADFGRKGDRQ